MTPSSDDVISTKTANDIVQNASPASDLMHADAHETLDKAESQLHRLRGNVDPVVDMLASKAQKMAHHSLNLAAQAKDRAEESLKRAAGVTSRYVSDQPMRSVLIAAGVGAAVALLVTAAARQRSRSTSRTRY